MITRQVSLRDAVDGGRDPVPSLAKGVDWRMKDEGQEVMMMDCSEEESQFENVA